MAPTARASRSAGRRSRGARSPGAYFTRFALEGLARGAIFDLRCSISQRPAGQGVSSDQKLDKARALGADSGIDYRTVSDWDIGVLQLTEGLDRVIEVGGAGTLVRSINAVRDEGQISLIGVLAGWAQEVGVAPLIAKNVRIQGFTVGSRAAFREHEPAITVSNVRPVIDRTFTFSEARNALAYLENGGQFVKIVIRVS